MLDEREEPVEDKDKHLSFNSQPVLSRIAIVSAGPMANFLLAIAALWLMYMVGIRTLIPQVGEVMPESPVAMAGLQPGDEIVAVDGEDTPSWQAVNMELLSYIGDSGFITLSVKSGEPGHAAAGQARDYRVKIDNWLIGEERPNPVRALGIVPFAPEVPAVIGQLVEGGAASLAGLEDGDKIISANGQPVEDWMHWVDIIRANPEQVINVVFERNGALQSLELTPGRRDIDGEPSGYIGAGVKQISWPDEMVRNIQFGPVAALVKGAEATWSLSSMTVESLWKMFAGLVSVKNLSGPITIAKVAGASLESGLENFLYFSGYVERESGSVEPAAYTCPGWRTFVVLYGGAGQRQAPV